ncbi:MAG: SDR family NAD(P)-dependent oxidoreductase, partial [Nocardioides sp.]|nr:SDR family NAD(P)-dependent oxidoreductase [Nocardioides sp.]
MNSSDNHSRPVAVITGGSAGLGLALTTELSHDGWTVVTDARSGARLARATLGLHDVVAVAGDVRDPVHRAALAAEVDRLARLDQ